MSSAMDDPSKPVTGYPPGYPYAQPSYPTTGMAYPYIAPPPAADYYPNPYPAPPYDSRRTTFLRRLIAAGIAVFLIIAAITFILWLVFRPQLPEFRVDSASISPFNVSVSSQLTANWDVGFSVRNPNKKMSVFYGRMEASVLYREEFLSGTTLAPFYQGKRNQTKMQARFTAMSAYVDDWALKEMAGDRSRRVVSFNVRMRAWVRFRAGAWRTRSHLMRVFCEDIRVGFTSITGAPGTLSGGSRECEVNLKAGGWVTNTVELY